MLAPPMAGCGDGRGALASAKHSGGAWVAPLPQEEISLTPAKARAVFLKGGGQRLKESKTSRGVGVSMASAPLRP